MCDAVYCILLDRLERQVLAVVSGAVAHGSEVNPSELFEQARQNFDEELRADPHRSSSLRLLRDLGVA